MIPIPQGAAVWRLLFEKENPMKKTVALLLLFCLLFPLLAACNGTGTPPSPDPNEVFGEGDPIDGTGASLTGEFTPVETVSEAITVTENDRVYRGVDFLGTVTVALGVSGTAFENCRFLSLENKGDGTAVVDSYVTFDGVGIHSTGNGLLVQNCRFEGTGTAIDATGDATEIRLCSIRTSGDGVGVSLGVTQNSLVALSEIRGPQNSVVLDGVCNTAVVRNSLISVNAEGSTNIYVCDNEMGGRVCGTDNDYFLADGNTYPEDGKNHTALLSGNTNTNGDTITDVNARLDVGANEEILPHINRELFVGMERRATVREYGAGSEKQLYAYILEQGRHTDYVVVAPGAYAVEMTAHFTDVHDGTTVYAYGVMAEGVAYENRSYNIQHIVADGVENLTVKGLTIGYAQPSCGQIYVLKLLDNCKVLAVTGAGFWNEFSNSGSNFFSATDVKHQRAGTFYSCNDIFVTEVEKNGDGTMTVTLSAEYFDTIGKGDVLLCRTTDRNQVVVTQYSKNVTYMDVTQYGYGGGFAFVENTNESGTTYYRVADIPKTGMIIEKELYDQYRVWEEAHGVDLEISTDEMPDGTRRYRGSPARMSSLDGTHSTACAEGSTVISSIFENITDDASNQNSVHARLSEVKDNGDGTTTLIYKGNLSARRFSADGKAAQFNRYCAPFREGDRVFIYTSAGQLICDAPALSDGYYYDAILSTYDAVDQKYILRYAVTVQSEKVNRDALRLYNLKDDSHRDEEKVLVDNMSRASANAYFDNNLFMNGATNGPRIKSPGCTVKNCTMRNIAKTATALIYDIWWGESGTVEGYLFKDNLIDHTGYNLYGAPTIDSESTSYKYTPICIMGLGGKSLREDHLLFKDIVIEGNKLLNRVLDNYNYAIYIRAACNVTVKGNDFGWSEQEDGTDVFCGVLYLNGAANVELSGNTYSPLIEGFYNYYVHGDKYKNVFGTDVSKNGVSMVKDKL